MCGRYILRRIDLAVAAFRAALQKEFEEFSETRLSGLLDARPGQRIPLIRIGSSRERAMGLAEWGLIPSWTKGKPHVQPINARSDKLITSGMYRQAFDRRRCLIPVDGFFEPKGPKPKRGEPSRDQYFFSRPDDGMFALAGIWERWTPSPGEASLDTVAIITTEPNAMMRPIHERMPLILDEPEYDRWLDRGHAGPDVLDLVKPYAGELKFHQVERPKTDEAKLDDPGLFNSGE